MTIIWILIALFGAVALMVILGERYAKPIDAKQQAKYSKILPILVFAMLFIALIKQVFESGYL
ncbi:hypothetical protein [Psychromonas sp. 14N.309.X.WAT.B.A12]|uniref:hypothetical protein n=1 Tax=unclassified Psychromonas TaxID=2614957 RepID=UPI0025B2540D|nr:hypothetical protein [Psychromonas sp. 14N.309.X.WAT.B.A12]MDN2663705.1 hypothetical protein [Psychromonas sp. 14N.309.X.WAT.B.A12]